MELNDLKIKNFIRDYMSSVSGNREKALEGFRRETEVYVYHFPKMAYRKPQDICSEFYLYLLERMDSVIRNYPLKEGMGGNLKFKTWFNYVLRNQFLNFWAYRKKGKERELSLDAFECEFTAVSAVFGADAGAGAGAEAFPEVESGLSRLNEADRIVLKFHYMPEALEGPDIIRASEIFGFSAQDVLGVQKNLIIAYHQDIEKKRELAGKIEKCSGDLREWKARQNGAGLKEAHDLLLKIARLESSKARLVRELQIPYRGVFLEFAKLFRDRMFAKRKLDLAKGKLKFEIMLMSRQKNGVK